MRDRLPPWFKQKVPHPTVMNSMEKLLRDRRLHTVCESAMCPNIGQCFTRRTATFMILGDTCTRRCTFCAVKKGIPAPVDPTEPEHVVEVVKGLDLRYVVLTSVTRDDLDDGGSSQYARAVELLNKFRKDLHAEVLIPDFGGSMGPLETVVEACPAVINHNMETVARLYEEVRPGADYYRSLILLAAAKMLDSRIVTKSGLMVGLGETTEEIVGVMSDLLAHGCDLLTIGQYLQPSPRHHPVVNFVPPEEFERYEAIGLSMGFKAVASAPLVRSSYKAAELYASTQRQGAGEYAAGVMAS
jgi:lipoic acid synthetase